MSVLPLTLALLFACGDKSPDDTGHETSSDGGSSDGGSSDGGSTDGGSSDGGSDNGDSDGDGYGASVDCDDDSALIHPGADELCDGLDNDCDEEIDEDPVDGEDWFPDGDGDGYGDASSSPTQACDDPSSDDTAWSTDATDCADDDDTVHPGAAELCNDLDDDCDDLVDDDDPDMADDTAGHWYVDLDGDGFGDEDAAAQRFCDDPGDGYQDTATDCDDSNDAINPGATEVCDGGTVDDDCDGLVDGADPDVDLSTGSAWYTDADGDGFGSEHAEAEWFCTDPGPGYQASATDCDDGDGDVNPDASEVCDEDDTDEDCDGLVDDADDSVSGTTDWYVDADTDGYGDDDSPAVAACDDPSTDVGYVASAGDCDDGDGDVNPDASEVCDEDDTDEDCDGVADDADSSVDIDSTTDWYADGDLDGYAADDADAVQACDDPSTDDDTYTDALGDCDDADADAGPGADEIYGDGIDADCDDSDRPPVECDGYTVPGDFSSISSAISSLRGSSEVQTVCLAAGSYSGFTISGNIELIGAGVDETIITSDVVMEAHANGTWDTTLRHMTLQEGISISAYSSETADYHLTDMLIETEPSSGGDNAVYITNDTYADIDLFINRTEVEAHSSYAGVYAINQSRGSSSERMDVYIRNSYIHGGYYGVRTYSSRHSSTYSPYLLVAVYGNTLMDNTYGIWFADGTGVGTFYSADNIIQGNSYGVYTNWDGPLIAYSAFYDNGSNFAGDAVAGSGNIYGDTELDDSLSPPTPSVDSPLVEAGSSSYTDGVDFWDRTRPSSPTIGAVEPWE